MLVFMPGGFEISQTIEAIRHTSESKGCIILPLHGELQPKDQDAAVARYRQPKVVVATNVAETSITIDGVRLVIDSGLARVARYDANRGINTLLVAKISQANADQRTGRAGRTAPGKCIRLWSRQEHDERAPHEMCIRDRPSLNAVSGILPVESSNTSRLKTEVSLCSSNAFEFHASAAPAANNGQLTASGCGWPPSPQSVLRKPIAPNFFPALAAARRLANALSCLPMSVCQVEVPGQM